MTVHDQPAAFDSRPMAPAGGPAERRIGPDLASDLVAVAEVLLLLAGGLAVTIALRGAEDLGRGALVPLVLAPVLTVLALKGAGSYRLDALLSHQKRLGRALVTWALALMGVVFVSEEAGIYAGGHSWLFAVFAAGTAVLSVGGAAMSAVVRAKMRAGNLQRRAVIVGGGPSAERLIQALEAEGDNEVRLLGIFDDRDDERSPQAQAGVPKLGTIADLVDYSRRVPVDLVIVALPMAAETRLLQVLKRLWVLPVDIRLAAHDSRLRLRPRSYSHIGRVPFLDLFDRPIAGWDSVVKRAFDLTVGSLALVALAPVMLLVALAVRLDSAGPVLFRQKRYGFNNEVIEVLKFRSLHHHTADPGARSVVTRDDPRVTRVGRILRRTSLDELPQLVNVLRGELSLVGPRPHAVGAHTGDRLWEEVVDGYFARHKVKPGITGWAQVNGWRGEVDRPEKIRGRVEHDLHYIENWSVLFDLYILLLTPVRIVSQEGAY